MKMPLSLLRTYLSIDEPLSYVAETLTLLGVEIDAVENETPFFSGVVVGEVLSTQPHPNADQLQIAEVFDGNETLQVVCGAPNCKAQMKTAFAKIGARLFDKDGGELRIRKAKIRGAESNGMLCSPAELSLSGGHEGIFELPSDFAPGEDLARLLCDPVFEISLTPNLGHCMSALGLARELAAAWGKNLLPQKVNLKENASSNLQEHFSASVLDDTLCTRYTLRLIENAHIAPSPFWLERALLSAGIQPINNVVDATNYILLKRGQPLHAFDADCITEKTLVIKQTDGPLSFHGLDSKVRTVPANTLVIADGEKVVALAGLLGGMNSCVTPKTSSVLLEAACFDSKTIRKNSKALDIKTDSSLRFEKGIDCSKVKEALDEAAALIAKLTNGAIATGVIDTHRSSPAIKTITLRKEKVSKLLGVALSTGEIETLLQRIECKTSVSSETLLVEPPPYRHDLNEEIDLIEEVARFFGYNHIEKKQPLCTPSDLPHDPLFLFEKKVKERATRLGLQEILHCDLISPSLAQLAPELLYPTSSLIRVMHAKSEEYSILRPSLLPGMLETIRYNIDQKATRLSLFEIGRSYLKQEDAFKEIPLLAIALCGKKDLKHWDTKERAVDFFDLKGIIESLLSMLGINSTTFTTSEHATFHPGRQANLLHQGHLIGSLGSIHPTILEKLDVKQSVYFAELNLSSLMTLSAANVIMKRLSQYPSTERDWTVTLPSNFLCDSLFHQIHSYQSPLLEKAELIDLYIFQEEGEEKRNATIRFTYRDPLKTISYEEAQKEHEQILNSLSLS